MGRRTRTLGLVACLEILQQVHRHVDSARVLKVDRRLLVALARLAVLLRLARKRLEVELPDLLKDALAERVERLANSSHAHVVDDDGRVHREAKLLLVVGREGLGKVEAIVWLAREERRVGALVPAVEELVDLDAVVGEALLRERLLDLLRELVEARLEALLRAAAAPSLRGRFLPLEDAAYAKIGSAFSSRRKAESDEPLGKL